jgi:leucyl aminopeptidase
MTTPIPALLVSETVPADALRIIGARPGKGGVTLVAGSPVDAIIPLLSALDVSGAADSYNRVVDPDDPTRALAIVGLGDAELTPASLLYASGVAARRSAGSEHIALDFGLHDTTSVAALLEGAALGAYAFEKYKSKPSAKQAVSAVTIVTTTSAGEVKLADAQARARAVALVKDLVNTPPNDMYPDSFVSFAQEAITDLPITERVWDEAALEREGFGGILGVGQGSSRPPRLMKLVYEPASATTHIALVGKGITFDTGGLSLKSGAGMIGMKYDMTGAATALAVTRAAAELGLGVKITAWLCMAENMPSGTATRPNDVITIKGGKTVEVLNTDAEGRLVLADGLTAASEEQPDVIIDIATLTGAATVALGTRYAGAMGDTEAISHLVEVARNVGENIWHMPLPEELRPLLNSDIADIANVKPGNTAGGMLIAATFLKDFVGKTGEGEDDRALPWIHLDIAGTANNSGGAYGFTGSGPTGVTVRTLISYAQSRATA